MTDLSNCPGYRCLDYQSHTVIYENLPNFTWNSYQATFSHIMFFTHKLTLKTSSLAVIYNNIKKTQLTERLTYEMCLITLKKKKVSCYLNAFKKTFFIMMNCFLVFFSRLNFVRTYLALTLILLLFKSVALLNAGIKKYVYFSVVPWSETSLPKHTNNLSWHETWSSWWSRHNWKTQGQEVSSNNLPSSKFF